MHYLSYPSLAYPYSHPWSIIANSSIIAQTDITSEPQNPFPPVSTKRLNTSAQRFQELMKQADLLTDKIVTSNEFAHELMNAAQLSNTKKVEELILTTGITLTIETKFTPTGISVTLANSEVEGGCCNLLMTLHW